MPRIPGEGSDAFLDSGPGAVVQADQRSAHGRSHVHDLLNLGGEHLTQRSAEDAEVMGEHEHHTVVDAAPSRDDSISSRPMISQAERH